MRQLSAAGQQAVNDIAQRHGFSVDATLGMLDAVIHGNGSMAQFNHPDFAGSGQWMRGGMTMVSDMFNNRLKGRVDSLCSELSTLVANQPGLVRSGSFQSQSQNHGGSGGGHATQEQASHGGQAEGHSQTGSFGPASLFVQPAAGASGDWWPSDLRWPNSTGAQNGVRYAHFAQARRLVIDVGGCVTVYDTLDHRIGGFSQQQSVGATLSFSSQFGLIDIASLPVVSSSGTPPRSADSPRAHQPSSDTQRTSATGDGRDRDVFATIERLADLRAKGVLSDDEFASKKAELLSRV